MIKLFLDTNVVYPDFNKVFSKLDFFGEYKRVVKKEKIINKFEHIVSIFIPEIVIMEFKQKCIEEYEKRKNTIDEETSKLEKVFGENLVQKSKLLWDSVEDYAVFLDKEMELFIKNSEDSFTIIKTPDCFQEVINNAIQKKPLFKEAKSASKVYNDAGFKDNVIYQTIKANIKSNETGIIFSKDNDFETDNDEANICIIKDLQELDEKIEAFYPKYKIYLILNELDSDLKKQELIDMLNYPFETFLDIIDFDPSFCELDENESATTIKIRVEIDKKSRKDIFVKYDINSNSLLEVFEL